MKLLSLLICVLSGALLFYTVSCRGGLMNRSTKHVVRFAFAGLLLWAVVRMLVFVPGVAKYALWGEHLGMISLIVLLWSTRHRWKDAPPPEHQVGQS